MEDFAALLNGLHGFSLMLGLGFGSVGGFVFAIVTYRFYGRNFRNTFERLSEEMKTAFKSLSSETLASSQQELMSLADRELGKTSERYSRELETKEQQIGTQLQHMKDTLDTVPTELEKNQKHVAEALDKSTEQLKESNQTYLNALAENAKAQTKQHIAELEAKKELIDQQLAQMSATLKTVPAELEKNQRQVSEVLGKSTAQLSESNRDYLNQLAEKAEAQTKQHIAELEAKKKLIDQQLEQMSTTLRTVPTELDKNQRNVSEVIEKSAKSLEESNKAHLHQLQEKSSTQTKEHFAKLAEKETQINRRLGEMDTKLDKVQSLIAEFEKARESKLGALDDQLKSLTATTSSLQRALADNQARGQWGERIAEQILEYLGLREGISYTQQLATPSGERPDYTFLLPNQLSLNMDCKFPIDNYLKYVDENDDSKRVEYSKNFLRNVEKHVTDVTKRDYINSQTVDCVLIFIPNEQIYRFINEQGSSLIDTALRNKVILCSPMTLYIVLAVIRQASQNFNVEQKSREIISLVNDIRAEWKKYADQMSKLERSFKSVNDNFHRLNFTRARALDRRFDRIEVMLESNEVDNGSDALLPLADDDVLEP